MTRQLENEQEQKAISRALITTHELEYGLSETLQKQGNRLKGLAITYNPGGCRMVIKGVIEGVHSVAFVYSDSAVNCLLKASREARNSRLGWGVDSYHP